MENLKTRVDVKPFTTAKDYKKWINKPNFRWQNILNKHLEAVHKIEVLALNKTTYVNMYILELSKTLIFDFYYNYTNDRCGKEVKLLLTDTDKIVYS